MPCVSLTELISGAREYDRLVSVGLDHMIHHQSQMWPASLEPNKEVGIEWFFRETLWHEITKGSINKTKIIYVYHTHVRLTRAASFSRSQTRQMSLTLCQDHLLRV